MCDATTRQNSGRIPATGEVAMAIAMQYLENLLARGLLRPGDRVLDIGCSNLYHATREALVEFMSKFGVVDHAFAKRLAEASAAKSAFAGELLDKCGLNYEAIDFAVDYKTTKFDLNKDSLPERFVGAFDVVLNFGTTEHVINQANSFQVIHDAAKHNGLIYHCLRPDTFITAISFILGDSSSIWPPATDMT
jgi:SAM-dependent methyltransferase